MPNKHRHAFTLIELSIVLVVIGLLVGSIFTGTDLIRAGQIRLQVSQIEKLNTAVVAFISKYNCQPGDCINSVALDLAASNGDGDGIIESGSVTALDGTEIQNFWLSLSSAGLISWSGSAGATPGVNSPPLAFKGNAASASNGVWIVEVPYTNRLPSHINSWIMLSTLSWGGGVYLPKDALALDTKMDDGYPASGIMGAMGDYNSTSCSGLCLFAMVASASDNGLGVTCINDTVSPAVYDLTTLVPTSMALCMPYISWAN